MVSEQLHYTTNREEIFIFSNKKCRIYAACGVSQTPIVSDTMKGKQEEANTPKGIMFKYIDKIN